MYAIEEREKARNAVRRLQNLALDAQRALQTLQPLPDQVAAGIAQLTGTTDTSRQIDALNSISEDVRRRHIAQLQPLARNDFNAFCEYINPDEPPESKWHIWLTHKLQEIEMNPELSRFILNCPPGHAKPLHVDTPVLMADGSWKRLGDIAVGEYVMTDKGRARKVTAVHEQGVLPLLRIKTKKGREILSAFDHSFRTYVDGKPVWKEAQALRPGSELQIVTHYRDPSEFMGDSRRTVRDAILSALFISIGSHVEAKDNQHYRLWVRDEGRCRRIESWLTEHGVQHSTIPPIYHQRHMIRVSTKAMTPMMPYLHISKKLEDRRTPAWVFTANDDVALAYVKTFIAVLGKIRHLKSGRFVYETRFDNFDNAQDIQRLLLRFGVETLVRPTKSGYSQRYNVVFDETAIYQFMKVGGFEGHPKLHIDDMKRRAEKPDWRDTVEHINIEGDGECRCLTVEQDHTFIANGVVVHNSTYASRLFVAWRMGRNPTHKVIGGGHSQTFVENEFSAKIRAIVGSPEFSLLFPEVVISSDTRGKGQWVLAGKGGQYAARGVGQGVHGFRAHFVVVDDPYSKIEAAESPVDRAKIETWFTGDLGSRMLPTGKMFLIMTRFHENDLTGYLMEQNKILPAYARWYQVEAPALCIDPETDILGRQLGEVLWDYYNLQYFVTKKTEWSFQRFSLVYQQRTDAISADKITGGFQYYHVLPHQTEEALDKARAEGRVDEHGRPITNKREYFRKIIVSVDTASKPGERNDYTVIQTWGETKNRQHYLLRQRRIKCAFPEMVNHIENQARMDDADLILVEDKGQGTAYIQARGKTETQRTLAPCTVVGIDPKGQSKEFRFDEVSPIINDGNCFLPARAPWLDAYLKEFGQFPEGAHDDQVDATTQYLKYTKSKRSKYGTREVGGMG